MSMMPVTWPLHAVPSRRGGEALIGGFPQSLGLSLTPDAQLRLGPVGYPGTDGQRARGSRRWGVHDMERPPQR